jgi:hypothetical protein
MNNQNRNNFLEEGEIQESDTKENEDEEDWGGVEQNEIIIPNTEIIPAIFSLQQNIIPRPTPESDLSPIEPILDRVRRREEVVYEPSKKFYRSLSNKRVARNREPIYNYLRLKSGEEFNFTEDDGKNLIINEKVESNRLVRNIISRIPLRVIDRIEYLSKFNSEEDSDDENRSKVKKRYLGNLKELVYEAYIKEWRIRFLFKRLLNLWRVYKMNKVCVKEVDPITLSEPEKEVYLYDWSVKKKFVFDAKSLATLIESKLMYQEYGFPVPMYPKNPKNNVEFSYKQMIAIYYQLKKYGELKWGFTTLREYNFNKNRWHLYHKSALTMNSIKISISLLDSFEAREQLSDFIFAKMDELEIRYTDFIVKLYNIAMISIPTHWYLEKLKPLAISHYEAEHFCQNRTRLINSAFLRIYKNQNKFIADLKNLNIV